jgi:signal transduction histidine kinase
MRNHSNTNCAFAAMLASALREGSDPLAKRWYDRIAERVDIDVEALFPSDGRRVDIPLLIRGIADYIENPVHEIGADSLVIAKAMALGALRYRQGFDVYEILKEFELLGGILFSYVARCNDGAVGCDQGRMLLCGHRLFRAIALIQQATVVHFVRLNDDAKREREERLRSFNRSVSHEIKNQIGALVGASEALLMLSADKTGEHERMLQIIVRNARVMQHTIENLVTLARTDKDARQHNHLQLAVAAREAARQLRENSRVAHVVVRLEAMPEVEVNAAAVELCVTNYLSNAIKYADPKKPRRYAVVSGSVESAPSGGREIVVRVRDNGLGVPPEKRRSLFQPFYRAHDAAATRAEGTGLGLSIVSETVASLGGRAWAEFPGNGSVFAFSLPYRRMRTGDAA